jgi:hypothetical protein
MPVRYKNKRCHFIPSKSGTFVKIKDVFLTVDMEDITLLM